MRRPATLVLALLIVLGFAACALHRVEEQRTTQGPMAEQVWLYHMLAQNGREPNFDERRHWEDQLDVKISKYLREHPEAASSVDVSTFRFYKQVAVGMTKEQVMILLGPPGVVTTDAGEMEKLASKYWPDIKGNATEVWLYPVGWRLYFAGPRLIDITQRIES